MSHRPMPNSLRGPAEAFGSMGARRYVDRAYDAFVQSNIPLWIRFADLHVGNREEAELIAFEIAFQLHERWEHVLHQENVERHALDLLRGEIVRWCAEHGVPGAMVPRAAFLRAMRASRRHFQILEESIGVFTAISQLPDGQYLVIVLRFVLGYEVKEVARVMGISPGTVATHTYHARQRLIAQLTKPLDELGPED